MIPIIDPQPLGTMLTDLYMDDVVTTSASRVVPDAGEEVATVELSNGLKLNVTLCANLATVTLTDASPKVVDADLLPALLTGLASRPA